MKARYTGAEPELDRNCTACMDELAVQALAADVCS